MNYRYRAKLPVTRLRSPIVAKRGSLTIKVSQPKQSVLPRGQKKIIEDKIIQNKVVQRPINQNIVKQKTVIDQYRKINRPINQHKSVRIQDAYSRQLMELQNSGNGRFLVMVACGPSVNEVDFQPILNNPKIDFMVINKPFTKVWPPKFWCFCDHSQYERNEEIFRKYDGTIITTTGVRASKPNQIKILGKKGAGWSHNAIEGCYVGRSSTFTFMQMALWMGYNKIFIFGCDMAAVDGQLHHYGVNPDVAPEIRLSRFRFEADSYKLASDILSESMRKRYYFCSSYNPWSFVERYNRLDHKTAVQEILKLTSI